MQAHPDDLARIFNWRWRLEHLYQIKTKEAELKQLKLNPVQQVLARRFPLWNHHLILKARQEGVSTFCELWHLDGTLFNENTNTCILADSRENLQGLFEIIRLGYETCPQEIRLADGRVWQKPKAKYDNRYELYFEGIKSTIYVALKVRSKTIHRMHGSEIAFLKDGQKVLAATYAAVVPNGIISNESTANGMGGPLYEEWMNEGSRFWKHFFGFQDHPDYCDPVEDEKAFAKTLTAEEQVYMTRKNMKIGNIAWMRRHLSIAANRPLFKQEYPSCPEEAFLTSGRSPFNREKVNEWVIRDPIERKMEGRLLYWIKPQKGRRYVVGVDTAAGIGIEVFDPMEAKEGGSDYSVVTVWDCETLQLCAAFRGKWPYSRLHHIVYDLGMEYNAGYLCIEATDHGLTVLNNLVEHVNMPGKAPYPKEMIHSVETVDEKSKRITKKWGFYTNSKTKPLILDHLAELIEDEEILCYWQKMQQECLQFVINDDGSMSAMEGYHDDTVMSGAIALYHVPHALRAGRMTATKEELGLQGM